MKVFKIYCSYYQGGAVNIAGVDIKWKIYMGGGGYRVSEQKEYMHGVDIRLKAKYKDYY